MQSKIQIAIDYDSKPVIKINFIDTDDVRDKLLYNFLGTLGFGMSSWCYLDFRNNRGDDKCEIWVYPISYNDLPKEISGIKEKLESEQNHGYQIAESSEQTQTPLQEKRFTHF